jgi:cob(I)alamin adenosyltransferase
MKIYTKVGDKGQTALYRGGMVSKSSARIEAYGTIDELNSFLGLVWDFDPRIENLQSDLFVIGALLSTHQGSKNTSKVKSVGAKEISAIEKWIDETQTILPQLKSFVLPGGSVMAIRFHLCRSICRRAERRIVELSEAEDVPSSVLKYVNRLSDLFFVLARLSNLKEGVPDIPWKSE